MEEWEIPYHELSVGKEVAKGTFAVVHRGVWRGIDVAIKTLENGSSKTAIEDQKNELRIMMLVHHPNIVLFLGYSRHEDRLFLVFEWMHGGNLLDAIRSGWVTRTQKMQWSRDICTAVLYLHQRIPTRIIHRDLKPANCLLDRHGMCKVADFGISKTVLIRKKRSLQNMSAQCFLGDQSSHFNLAEMCPDDESSSIQSRGPVGTFRYMAPELMQDMSEESVRSSKNIDIYSLGMILYMIWETKEPFWDRTPSIDEFCRDVCYYHLRPTLTRKTPPSIQDKIRACWDKEPTHRPSAHDLLALFSSPSPKPWWYRFL